MRIHLQPSRPTVTFSYGYKCATTESQNGGVLSSILENDTVQKALQKILTYRLTADENRPYNTAAGALGGAGTGALASWLLGRSPWTGAAVGGAGGAATGYWGPDLLQKLVGRWATNMITPLSYNAQVSPHWEYLKKHPWDYLKRSAKAIYYDRPVGIPTAPDPIYGDERSQTREPLFRAMFGLKPRMKQDVYSPGDKWSDSTVRLNPESDRAQTLIRRMKGEIDWAGRPDWRSRWARRHGYTGDEFENFVNRPATGLGPRGETVFTVPLLSRILVQNTPEGRIIEDPWDIGIETPPNYGMGTEPVRGVSDLVRGIASMVTNPSTVRVNVDDPQWKVNQ